MLETNLMRKLQEIVKNQKIELKKQKRKNNNKKYIDKNNKIFINNNPNKNRKF